MIEFNKKLVVIGCGAIGMTTLRLLSREFKLTRLVVIDKVFPADPLPENAELYVECLTKETYKDILAKYLMPGDICCNLAVVNSQCVLVWCMENDVAYLDTSGEVWTDLDTLPTLNGRIGVAEVCSLSKLHQDLSSALAELYAKYPNKKSWATSVAYHGMNPGLVNHFVKYGLHDIAKQLLAREEGCRNREAIQRYLDEQDWARLSQALGVKAVHISERDTQCSIVPRKTGEFQSTWSVDAFTYELRACSEFCIGTHEKYLPRDSVFMKDVEQESVILGAEGCNTLIMSWVPSGPIDGFLVTHDECLTLGKFLEVCDPNGSLEYRPTVLFAYLPCDASIASIHNFRMNGYQDPEAVLLKGNSILSGADEVGVLLLGHELGAWWTGSRLDHHRAMSILPESNATSIQVAAGVLGALSWIMQNPVEGFTLPEHLPHDAIMAVAKKYIEPFCSLVSDWLPLSNRTPLSLYDFNDRFGPSGNGPDAKCFPKEDSTWQLAAMLMQPSGGDWIPSPIYVGSWKELPRTMNTHVDEEDDMTEEKANCQII